MSVETSEMYSTVQTPVVTPPPSEPVYIGRSSFVRDLHAKIDLIAQSQAPVLVTGDSGTGKEVVARLIHFRAFKQVKPFIAINAASLPKDVVDNELFGHEKEAFTGAVSKKAGCFELAHGGTLFLDEIAEMHPQSQAKLLRAIENKAFRRLGGRDEVAVDTRIIAATNRNVPQELQSGKFREDLYYRLSVIEIALVPLNERREDIDLLVDHFNKVLSRKYQRQPKLFLPETLEILRSFDWPGNVRELRNLVERTILTCSDITVHPHHLPSRISGYKTPSSILQIPVGTTLREAERMIIDQTLVSVCNNKSAAARILGLTRKTLHNKLARR